MGCCVSTSKTPSQHPRSSTNKPQESRTPPPSSIEETVKEVVLYSETKSADYQDSKIAKPDIVKNSANQKGIRDNSKEEIFEALSDTSIVTERKEYNEGSNTNRDHNEVRQTVNMSPARLPPRNRSLSSDMGCKKERMVAKSPSRRFEQSPDRVNGMPLRMVQGRELGVSPGRRIDPGRRDPGESSGRKSRSPATRVIDGAGGVSFCRTPSAKRTNRSPGRAVRSPSLNPSPIAQLENERKEGEESNVESLENPLVSLECFIFL